MRFLMSQRQPITVLVYDRKYAKNNCYISQIIGMLNQHFDVRLFSLKSITETGKVYGGHSPVLSLLQMRHLVTNREKISKFLADKPLTVYDQDPWESFIDEGSLNGSYKIISESLNVKSFWNTSKWWTNFVEGQGFISNFVQMGISPKYITRGLRWEKRKSIPFFQGTLHQYRRDFFHGINDLGISTNLKESVNYQAFLKNLRSQKYFIHTSHPGWSIYGTTYCVNCCWIKDIEAASQGCFSIRNIDAEYLDAEINRIPSIITYESINDIPKLIAKIENMSSIEIDQIIHKSLDVIRSNFSWNQLVNLAYNI